MKNDLRKIPLVVEYHGCKYICVDGLVASATDKLILANAATMLKVGAELRTTLSDALQRTLAGFVLQVAGVVKGIEFTPVEMAAAQSMLDQKFDGTAKLVAARVPAGPMQCQACAVEFTGAGQICPDCVEASRTGRRPL